MVICLPKDNCFGRYFAHSQLKLTEVMYHVLWRWWLVPSMHTYLLMREVSGGTSEFIMWHVFLIIISYYVFWSLPESSLITKYVYRPPYNASITSTKSPQHISRLNWKRVRRRPKQLSSRQENCNSWRLVIIWQTQHIIYLHC